MPDCRAESGNESDTIERDIIILHELRNTNTIHIHCIVGEIIVSIVARRIRDTIVVLSATKCKKDNAHRNTEYAMCNSSL